MQRAKAFADQALGALTPVIAVLMALAMGAAMLLALQVNPVAAYSALADGAFGSTYAVAQTLVKVTDILFLASFTLMIVATFLMVYTVW